VNVNTSRRRFVDIMLERPIHFSRRGSFILRYDDIGYECI